MQGSPLGPPTRSRCRIVHRRRPRIRDARAGRATRPRPRLPRDPTRRQEVVSVVRPRRWWRARHGAAVGDVEAARRRGRRSARSSTSTARSSTATRRRRSPGTTCARCTSTPRTWRSCCSRPARGRRPRRTSSGSSSSACGRWAGRSEDELVELGERLFVQGIAGLALPRGVAAGAGAPARRAHRRPGVVGHPLPGGAGRPRDGRRARARHPGGDRERHRSPAARAARRCGGPARRRAVRAFAAAHGDRPERELRLLQRRRGRAVPRDRRPGPRAQPRAGAGQARHERGWPVGRFRRRGRPGLRRDRPHRGRRCRACSAAFAAGVALGALNGDRP